MTQSYHNGSYHIVARGVVHNDLRAIMLVFQEDGRAVTMAITEVSAAKVRESIRSIIPQITKATVAEPIPSLKLFVMVDYVNKLIHQQCWLIVFPVVGPITPAARWCASYFGDPDSLDAKASLVPFIHQVYMPVQH